MIVPGDIQSSGHTSSVIGWGYFGHCRRRPICDVEKFYSVEFFASRPCPDVAAWPRGAREPFPGPSVICPVMGADGHGYYRNNFPPEQEDGAPWRTIAPQPSPPLLRREAATGLIGAAFADAPSKWTSLPWPAVSPVLRCSAGQGQGASVLNGDVMPNNG